MSFVIDWQVKVTRSSPDDGGVETLIRTLERGEFFGERALQSYVSAIVILLTLSAAQPQGTTTRGGDVPPNF